jgi:hypothetical protein
LQKKKNESEIVIDGLKNYQFATELYGRMAVPEIAIKKN